MIKTFLLLTLLAVGLCSNYDPDDVMNELARDVIRQIGELKHVSLTFDELLHHNEKTKYDSTKADHVTRILLRISAHDSDDVTIMCNAVVSIPQNYGTMKLEKFDCDVPMNRRSGDDECTEDEKMKLRKAAMEKINSDLDASNAMLDFPGMPSFQQPHHVFDHVERCTKVTSQGGVEFKLEVKAHQDKTEENCVIRVFQDNSGHYDVTQNQCQGNNSDQ